MKIIFYLLVTLVLFSACQIFDEENSVNGEIEEISYENSLRVACENDQSQCETYMFASSDELFNPDSLYHFEILMLDSLILEMNKKAREEIYYPAVLMFNNQYVGKVGIRYKGNVGSLIKCTNEDGSFEPNTRCPKLSLKIKINLYDEEKRFFGLKKLNLHAMMLDKSLLRDRVSYKLFREFGVVAPRAVHATLSVNDNSWGIYSFVENVDGRFTDKHFDGSEDGNLYKETWPIYDEVYYKNHLKTNEEIGDVSRLVEFTEWLSTGGNESKISEWLDIESVLKFFIVDDVINRTDGISAWYCDGEKCAPYNFYLFEEEGRGARFKFIPWDMDNTLRPFGDPFEDVPYWNEKVEQAECDLKNGMDRGEKIGMLAPICTPLIKRLMREYREESENLRAEFLEEYFNSNQIDTWIDEWAEQISSAVQEEPFLDVTKWQAAVDKLKIEVIILRETALDRKKSSHNDDDDDHDDDHDHDHD